MKKAKDIVALPQTLEWNGDNRVFVVEILLPRLKLSPDVRQVIRWAYGYDGSPRSYEMESDGSSVVPDLFLGGLAKEPIGVGHDFLFILHHLGLPTPDGHVWTFFEANSFYFRGECQFGYPAHGVVRWTGLTIGSWVVWCRNNHPARPRRYSWR